MKEKNKSDKEGYYEQRTLDELIELYVLEPSLIDIYVEGTSDKGLILWFLNRLSKYNVNVHTIDTINISDLIIKKHNLNFSSNRSKIIALSAELHSTLPKKRNVLCVVDRDYHDYINGGPVSSLLQFTDGNSMECYYFKEAYLRKFSLVISKDFDITLIDIMPNLKSILRDVYKIRLANEILGWGMKSIPFTGYVKINGTNIFLEENNLITAYLHKNNRWKDRELFYKTIANCSVNLSYEVNRSSRGHDISELLLHILHKISPKCKFGDTATLEGVLLGMLELEDLKKTVLFQKIMAL